MINFKHNELQMSRQKACWKRYDGVDALKWSFEIEPFVARQVVQMEENTHKLGVVEDYMLP
jgi:hypothetical protein